MLPRAPPGARSLRAILPGHAGPQVRRGEPRGRPRHAREPRTGPGQRAGLPRPRRGGPLGPRHRAPRPHPGGGAAAPPPARGRRGDRPARQGEGGRVGAQGRDEGRRRPRQGGRRAARGGEGGDRAVPARGAERARRERARGTGRLGQRRGAAGRHAARLRLRAEIALGPGARARHPRLRACGPYLGGALHRLLGPGRAPRARAHPVHAGPARLAGLPGVIPPYLVTAETLTGTGQLPKFEGDLFKTTGGDATST